MTSWILTQHSSSYSQHPQLSLSLSRPSTATPDSEPPVSLKHPLRIDLRHNNPERGTRIAEDLLECSLYSTRVSSLEGNLSYEKAQLFRKIPTPVRVEYESRPSTSGSAGKGHDRFHCPKCLLREEQYKPCFAIQYRCTKAGCETNNCI